MLKSIAIVTLLFASTAAPSHAGFQQWTMEKEADPFSGGEKVSVNFMSSMRSGIFLVCDTAQAGLLVRAIPGFAFEESLDGFAPSIKFAFDGKVLFDVQGETGRVGDNQAASQVMLVGDKATGFVEAFAQAQKQIAISDGIADKPHLLSANGSTASGQAIVACIKKQPAN